jgi:NAD(P)-dependent dehydrogenase (short-subunit alcohol dehydrogenase family)
MNMAAIDHNSRQNYFNLSGRTAFVSGASGRLGAAMAQGLAEAGAEVILNGRNAASLESLAANLSDQGLKTKTAVFDICDDSARNKYLSNLGRLDILVNNAYNGKTADWKNVEAKDFRDAYEIGVIAGFSSIKDAEAALKAAAIAVGHASVINIGSMYGSVSPDPQIYHDSNYDNPASYGAAKAALLQLTRYAATNLAPHKIRVNCLSPGPFPPAELATSQPEFYADLVAKIPLQRIGEPHELVGSVVFLASDAASYITGIELPVDGGWRTW